MSIITNISDFYNNVETHINIHSYQDITVKDLVALIQLVQTNTQTDIFNVDDSILSNIKGTDIDITVYDIPKQHILVTLYLISKYRSMSNYHPEVFTLNKNKNMSKSERNEAFYENLRFTPDDEKEFLDLVTESGMINYSITRCIIESFHMNYVPNTEFGDIYLKKYLGISYAKS